MIKNIKSIEIETKKFPFIVKAMDGKIIVNQWEFNGYYEALEAMNSIWNEILREKLEYIKLEKLK